MHQILHLDRHVLLPTFASKDAVWRHGSVYAVAAKDGSEEDARNDQGEQVMHALYTVVAQLFESDDVVWLQSGGACAMRQV